MCTRSAKLLIILCLLFLQNTVRGQSLGYSGQFCAGSSIEFFTIGGFPCGEAMVSSPSSWSFSHAPASITFPNSFNYNRVRVTWNNEVSGVVIRASYTCSQSAELGDATLTGVSIRPVLVPGVSLELSSTFNCQGSTLLLQATQVNGGNTPTYMYYVDGSLVGSGSADTYSLSTGSLSPGSHTAQVTLVSSAPCVSSSNASSPLKLFSIAQRSVYTASITEPPPVCAGTELTVFHANVSGTTGNLTYEWFVNGNPTWGTSSMSVPANPGTQVYCKVYSDQWCVASPQVSQIATVSVNPLTTPTASIQIPKLSWCPGETMTLTATSPQGGSSFTWYVNGNLLSTSNPVSLAISSQPAPGRFYPGSVVSVRITGLTGLCLSQTFVEATTQGVPIVVNSTPVPQLDGPATVCQDSESTYLTETGMSNYRWTVTGGTIIAGGSGLNNTITIRWNTSGTASLSVAYINAVGCDALVASVRGINVVLPPTAANAGPDQIDGSTCGRETVTLAANSPIVGTGWWSIIGGLGGVLSNPTLPNAQFMGVAGRTYVLRWTINNGLCPASFDEVVVTFHQAPSSAFAGTDITGPATCGVSSVQLSADTPTNGIGSWTIAAGTDGNFSLASNPKAIFTGRPGNHYVLRWIIDGGICGTSSDEVEVKFNSLPTPANAGEDQVSNLTCGLTSTNLQGNIPAIGSGYWTVVYGIGGTISSPSSPSSSFTGLSGNTYILRWTITSGPCAPSADELKIHFNLAPSIANAGIDQQDSATCGQSTVVLQANSPVAGAGVWSVSDGNGGMFGNPYSATSSFSGLPGNSYRLRWTINSHPCPSSSDEVVIRLHTPPDPAQAGPDVGGPSTCGQTSVALNANSPTNGIGSWSVIVGSGGVFEDPGDPRSNFNGVPGTFYALRWTIENAPCDVAYDEANVLFGSKPAGYPLIQGNIRFGEGPLDLLASGAGPGETYEWVDDKGELLESGASYHTPLVAESDSNSIFVRILGTNSCRGESSPVNITVFPQPAIQSSVELVRPGVTATLSVGAYDSYQWLHASGQTISEEAELHTGTAGEYRVIVALNGISTTTNPFRLKGQFDDQIATSVITYRPQVKGIVNRSHLETLTVDSVSQSIQYFDGLGRPVQTVSTQSSPSRKDYVLPFAYDRLGREAKKYLPITTGNDGRYKPGLIDTIGNLSGDALRYYSNNSDEIADDPRPTAVTLFEPSPHNRILEQGAHGQDWQPGGGHTIRQAQRASKQGEVLLFEYDYSTGLLRLNADGEARYYQPNQLLVTQSLDEQGQEALTFSDKNGKTICRKLRIQGETYACTYYIYDRLGNLVVVLPPEGVNQIINED